MTFDEFIASAKTAANPPENLSPALQALWHARTGDWECAHTIVQKVHSAEGSWVHAWLHRHEGDLSNADHWYARAGKTRPDQSLDAEWEKIVRALLG